MTDQPLSARVAEALTEAFQKRDEENDFDPRDMLTLHARLVELVEAADKLSSYNGEASDEANVDAVLVILDTLADEVARMEKERG